jgi:hypothetical protein
MSGLRRRALGVAACVLVAAGAAVAQSVKPHRLARDHPIVGSWTYTAPDGSCTETYLFRPDGTSLVTSGSEIAESVFDIAPRPDPNGFYKWTDRIVRDNGKEDCSGEVTPVGKAVTNYVLFSPRGDQFIVCAQPSLDACFGPLRRAQGSSV